MNAKQIFVIAIIAMFLIVPFASAKQESVDVGTVKQDKKIEEKAVDKTKEQPKEVKNKDKEITGKITVTDSNTSAYTVTKEGNAAIKIKKDGEHTKAKVTIPKEELQKIDKDGDKLYGVLHIADDGSTTHDVVTESELIAGTEMVFSENIVNGYAGYREYTFTGVTSGQTLDIEDVSGSGYYISASVNGTIPTSSAITETDKTTYPVTPTFLLPMNNATDVAGGKTPTAVNMTYSNSAGIFNKYSYITYPDFLGSSNFSIMATVEYSGSGLTTTSGIVSQRNDAWGGLYFQPGGNILGGYFVNSSGATTSMSNKAVSANTKYVIVCTVDNYNKKIRTYVDNVLHTEKTYVGNIRDGSGALNIGQYQGEKLYGKIYTVAIWNNSVLSTSSISSLYSMGYGISFKPIGSYNHTRYDVASGVEKIIDTDATCTGLEYIDTTGGTHTVTVRIYFTEEITKSTETKGAVYQNVSIIHTKQNATASVGTIVYELDPLYSGTPVLSSNNTNATVTRNDTHAIISTGLVKQGQSFSYAVSVQDDHNHGIHLGNLMKWVGTGWDFVSTAPEDWDDYIGDQIKVIVS